MSTPTQDTDDVRVISARLYADSPDALFALVAEHSLDFGCRPSAHRDEDERLYTPAFLSPRELQELTDEGVRVEVQADRLMDQTTAAATIGQGDRFEDGARPPQGAGSREEGSTREIGPIMNVDEIGSAIDGLVNEFGLPTITLPNGTAEGTPSTGGQVGPGIDPGLYHVYFTAGVHPRERGGPDGLIYFIADLLHAQRAGTGLTYGSRSYSNADVITALNTGIVFFPLVNPDGLRHDQATDSLWRKNRNPASSDGTPQSVGVDINRNYDFLWDFRTKFHPAVTGSSSLASDNPRLGTSTAPGRSPSPRRATWPGSSTSSRGCAGTWTSTPPPARSSTTGATTTTRATTRACPSSSTPAGTVDAESSISTTTGSGSPRRTVGPPGESPGGSRPRCGRSVAYLFELVQAVGLFPTSGASDDYAFSRFQAKPQTQQDLRLHHGVRLPDKLLPDHHRVPPEPARRRRRPDGVLSGRCGGRTGLDGMRRRRLHGLAQSEQSAHFVDAVRKPGSGFVLDPHPSSYSTVAHECRRSWNVEFSAHLPWSRHCSRTVKARAWWRLGYLVPLDPGVLVDSYSAFSRCGRSGAGCSSGP